MAIDVETRYSPGWWMTQLDNARLARLNGWGWGRDAARGTRNGTADVRPPLTLLHQHLRGDPPLNNMALGWSPGMRSWLRMSRMNYGELITDSVGERMVPGGFYTAVDSDFDGDKEAARIFRANDLELVCADLWGWMLGLGDAYGIVGPPDPITGVPRITAEDPRQVITADDPGSGRAVAALKVFTDEWTGENVLQLWLPGQVYGTRSSASGTSAADDWAPDLTGPLPTAFQNVVPVVHFANRRGIGEFESHLDVLDRINDGIFDRVVLQKHQAYRQMAVKNLPEEDEDGNKIDYDGMFVRDPGAFWKVPEGVDFWESQALDLGPIREAGQDDVKGLAVVTRTPLHWITPDAAQGSAEGASLQRESSTTKVEDRRRRGNRGLARLMSTAFAFSGDQARADETAIKTIWLPATSTSLTERYDAGTKAASIGMPLAAIGQHILELTPDDIARVEAQRDEEQLFNPQPAPGAPGAGQPPVGAPARGQGGAPEPAAAA